MKTVKETDIGGRGRTTGPLSRKFQFTLSERRNYEGTQECEKVHLRRQ